MGTRNGRGRSLSMPSPGRIDRAAVYEGGVIRLSVGTVRILYADRFVRGKPGVKGRTGRADVYPR